MGTTGCPRASSSRRGSHPPSSFLHRGELVIRKPQPVRDKNVSRASLRTEGERDSPTSQLPLHKGNSITRSRRLAVAFGSMRSRTEITCTSGTTRIAAGGPVRCTNIWVPGDLPIRLAVWRRRSIHTLRARGTNSAAHIFRTELRLAPSLADQFRPMGPGSRQYLGWG